jgi:hypothetical protein
VQCIPDSSSDSEWSNDEDSTDSNGNYLAIPASDEEINSEDEDDIPLSIRYDRLMSKRSLKKMKQNQFG